MCREAALLYTTSRPAYLWATGEKRGAPIGPLSRARALYVRVFWCVLGGEIMFMWEGSLDRCVSQRSVMASRC